MSATVSQPSCVLRQYRVKRFLVEERCNQESVPDLRIVPDVCFQADSKGYRAILRCEYSNDKTLFRAVIEGEFEFKEAITQNNAIHAWVNGETVLYGILRGIYSSATAQCTGAVDVLPTVMMIDYVKCRIQELIDKTDNKETKADPPKSEKRP